MATLENGPPRVPISWVSLSPFDKMEFGQDEWAEVVTPQDLPFNWDTTPKLSMKEALFWKLTFQDNYGHLLGEHGPIIHNLMCSYLNRLACIYMCMNLPFACTNAKRVSYPCGCRIIAIMAVVLFVTAASGCFGPNEIESIAANGIAINR